MKITLIHNFWQKFEIHYLCVNYKSNFHSMKEIVEKINASFEAFQKDAVAQVETSNKAAGTRARKASLDLEKLLKDFRKASLEESKK